MKGVKIEANSCIGAQALVAPREYVLFGKKKLDESKGQVIIKEDCHIGPLNSIFLAHKEGSKTIIGKNVITGGNITIGHDVVIGEESIIHGNSMLSGYVQIGKKCRIGPSAVIRNRITIGDEAIVSMGSVVTRDVPPKKRVTGNFALDHDIFIRNLKKSLE
jgi:UDP-3-O-[3-hydroxymyristoyl] glucosamine N-acyltransferase